MVERHHIEGQTAENVAQSLKGAYDKYCGATIDEEAEIFDPLQGMQIDIQEARQRRSENTDRAFLDVREGRVLSKGMIEGAIAVHQAKAQEIISNWPREREIIAYCEQGTCSLQATQFFQSHGFENIKSLSGGCAEWSATP